MPVVPTQEILKRAFAERYGVAAINVVNDLTMEAVLAAAEELRAPLIVQTSVKHVEMTGVEVMYAMWAEMTEAHHACPSRSTSTTARTGRSSRPASPRAGTRSCSTRRKLTVEENKRQCIEVVAEARRYGALRRGRDRGLQAHRGDDRRRGRARPDASRRSSTSCEATGVDVFAPAIGNAHGTYKTAPHLDSQRVTDIVEATGIPVALHGGTGMCRGAVHGPHQPRLRQGQHLARRSRSRS